MNKYPSYSRLLRSALLVGAISAICAPVLAQDQDDEEEVLDEVIITGTRIQNQNIIAASPITTIGTGAQIALIATTNRADLKSRL